MESVTSHNRTKQLRNEVPSQMEQSETDEYFTTKDLHCWKRDLPDNNQHKRKQKRKREEEQSRKRKSESRIANLVVDVKAQ